MNIIFIILVILIYAGVNFVDFLLNLCNANKYDDWYIESYIEAIERTWNNYPIKDISLTRKSGYKEIILLDMKDIDIFCECSHIDEFKLQYKGQCSDYQLEVGCNEYNPINKASKLYGTKLYASYYEADYLTFINRLRNDKGELNNKLCKDGYKRCGYLDIFNNTLCVKEEEDCPINDLRFILKNGTISEIITDNTKKDSYIINQLIASEFYNPTIFDINKFYPLYDEIEYISCYEKEYYLLSKINISVFIRKSTFFEENELMKGIIPDNFKYREIELYHLIYPGMKIEYPIKFLSLIKVTISFAYNCIHLFIIL